MTASAEAVERMCSSAIRRRVSLESGYEVIDGDWPLEVRDRRTGETFILEVRALPTGG